MDKPVLPSSLLDFQNEMDVSFTSKVFGNNSLKLGVIVEVLDVSNEENKSKMGKEYHVMAIEQDKSNGINSSIYKNCLSFDSFGGVADFFEFKRRAPEKPKEVRDSASTKNQSGTIVLLLCLDNNGEKAVVIGHMKNPSRKVTMDDESGNFAVGELNGIRYTVEDSGALNITFKGATDINGIPEDAAVGGTEFKIEEDGSLEVNTAALSSDLASGNKKLEEGEEEEQQEEEAESEDIAYEKIRLDKTEMTLDIEARKNISVTTDADLNLTSKTATNIAAAELIASIQGAATISAEGAMSFDSKAAFSLKAASAEFTLDGSLSIKGSSVEIDGQTIAIGKGGSPALTLNTQFLGTGFAGVPVISSAIGPFSSIVTIAP